MHLPDRRHDGCGVGFRLQFAPVDGGKERVTQCLSGGGATLWILREQPTPVHATRQDVYVYDDDDDDYDDDDAWHVVNGRSVSRSVSPSQVSTVRLRFGGSQSKLL